MVSRFERSKQEAAYEAQIATQSDALKRWLENRHPEIKYGEAVLKAFMEDMGGSFLYAADADFEYSLSTTRTNFSRRRIPTEKEVKADLIDEISSLIASKNYGRDGKYSPFRNGVEPSELDKERTRMSFWDVPKLTERLQEVIRKQELNTKSIGELQQMVANSHEQTVVSNRELPLYTDDGKPLDADYLNGLARFDKANFIRLVKRWGSEAIDRRRGIR